METKIARCGRAIKDKTIGYKNRNSANKVSMSRSQNTFARIEREALKNAMHRSTIPDIVIIVKIIFVLRLILEARYELIQKVAAARCFSSIGVSGSSNLFTNRKASCLFIMLFFRVLNTAY